jgi:hypothetical protein
MSPDDNSSLHLAVDRIKSPAAVVGIPEDRGEYR